MASIQRRYLKARSSYCEWAWNACARCGTVAPACRNCCLTRRTANGDELSTWTWSIQVAATSLRVLLRKSIRITLLLPNGSRLSCGRNAHRRKAVEPQIKRLAGEATQFLP